MTKRVDLLIGEALPLADMRSAIESALGVSLAAHESDYQGGEYFRFATDAFSVVLQKNFEEDGDLTEPEHVAGGALLYLTGDEATVIRLGSLALQRGFRLLRSNTY